MRVLGLVIHATYATEVLAFGRDPSDLFQEHDSPQEAVNEQRWQKAQQRTPSQRHCPPGTGPAAVSLSPRGHFSNEELATLCLRILQDLNFLSKAGLRGLGYPQGPFLPSCAPPPPPRCLLSTALLLEARAGLACRQGLPRMCEAGSSGEPAECVTRSKARACQFMHKDPWVARLPEGRV